MGLDQTPLWNQLKIISSHCCENYNSIDNYGVDEIGPLRPLCGPRGPISAAEVTSPPLPWIRRVAAFARQSLSTLRPRHTCGGAHASFQFRFFSMTWETVAFDGTKSVRGKDWLSGRLRRFLFWQRLLILLEKKKTTSCESSWEAEDDRKVTLLDSIGFVSRLG